MDEPNGGIEGLRSTEDGPMHTALTSRRLSKATISITEARMENRQGLIVREVNGEVNIGGHVVAGEGKWRRVCIRHRNSDRRI